MSGMLNFIKCRNNCVKLQKAIFPVKLIKCNGYATEASFELKPFMLHRLEKGPSSHTKVTNDEAKKIYRNMKTVREMETAAAKLYREKKIYGFCHLCSGQEAVYVGLNAAMRKKDMIISSYRIHAITYLSGVPLLEILSELTGRKSGCSRGKGGSMHMFARNFYGGNAIVGSQVPLGTGLAFASNYKKDDAACFTLYGDGAANNGQVYESYNLAKLWNLPVVFVIENNLYAMGTSLERASSNMKCYTRGDFIPGIWVNGMGVLEVREAARFSLAHIQAGKGPLLLEIETYRYHGHSMSDPGTTYRPREEIAEVRKTHDPINTFKDKMLKSQLLTDDELKSIDDEITIEVLDAVKHADGDPEPPEDEVAADIYSNPLDSEVRGTHPWNYWKHKRIGKAYNIE